MKEWNYENEQWIKLPDHLKHLPLFTRNRDWTSIAIRFVWGLILKFLFTVYIRLEVVGDYKTLFQKYPKLLLISNHASHLDAVTIATSIRLSYWQHLYISAAKDYFFSNPLFTFFSKHCLGAIPIDRNKNPGESIRLCLDLIRNLHRIWLILFPEGTRSPSGEIQSFKRGASIFSIETQTPILFLYLQGNHRLWPKGRFFAKPGRLKLFIGPVYVPPTETGTKATAKAEATATAIQKNKNKLSPEKKLYTSYKDWVKTIDGSKG